jgi:hypothetical protein
MIQDRNGTPYFAYYDTASQFGFVWDGRSACIEVTQGGMGEKIIDHLPIIPRATIANASALRWMEWFQLVCTNYIRLQEA